MSDKLKFYRWLRKCDAITSKRFGLGIGELPDASWADYFADGFEPIEAVANAQFDYWMDDIPADFYLDGTAHT
tara:strand:+ start:84 stop:302 length:219 start_codon:yes stop_codon:yes gene_type:complete